MDVRGGYPKALASAGGNACQEPGRVVGGEPIQRASQALIVEHLCCDPSAQEILM